ncbi:MAG TPA: lysine-sensitive aspartokinase 3 [Vicinamibacteria bacterium]|nr:lysine-sensitive aspartokinase 3 [Vicinamibacteria bacterium]
MKFGGTSVGSPERVRGLAERVRERRDRRPVVVVSAFSKVTDLLVRGANLALARDADYEAVLAEVLDRHRDAIRDLVPEGPVRQRLLDHLGDTVGELRALYTGVYHLAELTARTLDAICGTGERLSYEIVAAALQQAGVRSQAVDARGIVVTDENFGRATPLLEETAAAAARTVSPLLEAGTVPVLPGFIGSTRKGVATTLGRGGSDWSAAVIGAALAAEEIQIWTDVDGMMTVDPRVVSSARVIPEVSFDEAAELAYFGAKVLHPATIRPAVERGIPVRILNSLNPSAPGTLIAGRVRDARRSEPRAVAFKKGIAVVLIAQPRMLMAYGFVARVFEVFDRHRTAVDLIATSEVSISLTVDDPASVPAVEEELARLGEVQVLHSMAIVSIVGRGFTRQSGLAARVFQSLGEVNVIMISFGASDVNLSFVVAEADAEKAVRALHREFFEAAR